MGAPGRDLAVLGEFGPWDELSEIAHGRYVDGHSAEAVAECRRWLPFVVGAGDHVTARYLRYTESIALQELGRYAESVAAARRLLATLGDEPAPVWRAKALAMIAESSTRDGLHSEALTALAEADDLVGEIRPGTYGHMSASMAVALALRSVNLVEQADERLRAITTIDDPHVLLLAYQELGQLSAYWGASLLLVGEVEAACTQLLVTAQRALRTQKIAREVENEAMVARAEVVEGWAMCRLGEPELGLARVRAARGRFEHRPELLETQLMHLVEGGAATAAGDFDEARAHVERAVAAAQSVRRDTWLALGLEALADVDVAQYGEVPALGIWRSIARTALRRVWAEREGRFAALQDRSHVQRLTAETDRMGQAVLEDPLTGLGNRRLLRAVIEEGGAAALSAVFVDLDDFKSVNDRFSHEVGDQVLRAVAGLLRDQCRSDDVLVRYGGDEFLVLTPGGPDVAEAVAHRIHAAVRDLDWEQVASGLRVTASVGVGLAAPDEGTPLSAADHALLQAKREGRDRVVRVDADAHVDAR